MNTLKKILLSILGGTNAAFGMFVPIAISLLLIQTYPLNETLDMILIIVGVLSTFYRGIRLGFT